MVRYVAMPIPIAVSSRQTGAAQTGAPDCLVDGTALAGTVLFDATVLLREGRESSRCRDNACRGAHVRWLAAGHVADLRCEHVGTRLDRRTRLRLRIGHRRGDLVRGHTR